MLSCVRTIDTATQHALTAKGLSIGVGARYHNQGFGTFLRTSSRRLVASTAMSMRRCADSAACLASAEPLLSAMARDRASCDGSGVPCDPDGASFRVGVRLGIAKKGYT